MLESLPGKLVGVSADSARLRGFIEAAAQSSEPVTFMGEPGTGKQLAAKLIHESSPRKEAPFLMIDCSLYYERELKRELFGYLVGGAKGKSRKGLFEFASKGTCYLSRIEELTPGIQESLLDFLNAGRFRRLGDSKQIISEVRLLVSSDKNLHGFVEAGLFNSTLYRDISKLSVYLPPLRRRREDVVTIVDHFMEGSAARGAPSKESLFSPEALEALQDYPWPGNIDELLAELDRLVESDLRRVEPEHLAVEISNYWLGQRGDPQVRKVIEELDGYIREFRVLSRLDLSFRDLLKVSGDPYHAIALSERDLVGE